MWDFDSKFVHDYSKSFLLEAYIILHKFDIVFSETYLDYATPIDVVS